MEKELFSLENAILGVLAVLAVYVFIRQLIHPIRVPTFYGRKYTWRPNWAQPPLLHRSGEGTAPPEIDDNPYEAYPPDFDELRREQASRRRHALRLRQAGEFYPDFDLENATRLW